MFGCFHFGYLDCLLSINRCALFMLMASVAGKIISFFDGLWSLHVFINSLNLLLAFEFHLLSDENIFKCSIELYLFLVFIRLDISPFLLYLNLIKDARLNLVTFEANHFYPDWLIIFYKVSLSHYLLALKILFELFPLFLLILKFHLVHLKLLNNNIT